MKFNEVNNSRYLNAQKTPLGKDFQNFISNFEEVVNK